MAASFLRPARLAALALVGMLATGCVSSVMDVNTKASQPIPARLVSEMREKSMTPASPIVVRIFKQESELEVWKRTSSGKYALLKTYPICRWSGQLGPKTRNGDRQAPEGFYHVNARMLNPNSQYYLSFDLGYPNKLEAALGYSGSALMVHGACSSSGCYAITDDYVAELYAVAREAFRGGQNIFQVQAYPFRMTPQNMARNRDNPNFDFWMNLKQGYDAFEVTRQPPTVSYCGRRYAFNDPLAGDDPLAACPADAGPSSTLVSQRSEADKRAMELLLSSGSASSAYAYSDGGMHPSFRTLLERNGEKSLAKRTSRTSVPVSRPSAALADPYAPK